MSTERQPGVPRAETIDAALAWFDQGGLFRDLARRVAIASESQESDAAPMLLRYLEEEMRPTFEGLGFEVEHFENPVAGAPPMMIARRFEPGADRTVLMYGHGDVVRGQAGQWQVPRSPWQLSEEGDFWYGRGSADNKGQHSINLAAIEQILDQRDRLGLNLVWLIEMGEERGSPGLEEFCRIHRDLLAADLFLASDGPRLNAATPTVFLGSRGCCNFELTLTAREGAHHSGNWGGLLMNPAVRLAHAVASMVDERGRILVEALQSPPVPASVHEALKDVIPGEPGGPAIGPKWADPDRSLAERVFASNTLEVLALGAGRIDTPVNAIPGVARAVMQLRFVPGTDSGAILSAVQAHLDGAGFADVRVASLRDETMRATRLDPHHPMARMVRDSISTTLKRAPAVLPSFGGTLPNACFADVLGLPTVWVPHSYPGCNQHAPDEHLRASVAREALAIMVGILIDLADTDQLPEPDCSSSSWSPSSSPARLS